MSFPEMKSRLDKEQEKLTAMISKNTDLIKNKDRKKIRNTAFIRKNSSSISGNSAMISKNSTSISENSNSIR